uniref:Uncharacterized protein n=1 Tax=Panagrolaimus sp. ES5 TaxID=591445 RepID=A0AC34FSY1_9BILA
MSSSFFQLIFITVIIVFVFEISAQYYGRPYRYGYEQSPQQYGDPYGNGGTRSTFNQKAAVSAVFAYMNFVVEFFLVYSCNDLHITFSIFQPSESTEVSLFYIYAFEINSN